MGYDAYVLDKGSQFQLNIAPKDSGASITLYGLPNGNVSTAVGSNFKPGDYTAIGILKENPDWIRVKNDKGEGWINIGLTQGKDTAIPLTEDDKFKLINAVYQLSFTTQATAVDEDFLLESSQELKEALRNFSQNVRIGYVDSYTPSRQVSANEEIVDYYEPENANVENMYNHYLLLALEAYGGPPQWTPYVDRRILNVTGGYMIGGYAVGRKFANTVIAAPTILSLCPGVIKYNSIFGATLASDINNEDALIDNISSKSGRIVEFQPCWRREVSGNKPYIEYVNTLNQVTAIAMSRARDTTASNLDTVLSERIFPGNDSPYYKFDWANYDDKASSVSGIFSGFSVNGIKDTLQSVAGAWENFGDALSSATEAYKYVNFYCSGSNSTKESFETSVRSTQIEDLVNSNISSVVKDVAYFTGGIFSDGGAEDIQAWADSVADELGGIGNLLENVFELASGGKIEFPQVVDDCTYGKECQFTIRFVAGSADVESRYLMRCEFNHFLALILPRQLETSLNMYAIPFLVRAVCPGRFSCEMGVISGVNISYGGADDNAWTINAQPTEIEVTFGITPLYNKLFMSASSQLQTYFLKNSGLIEYLVSNCGVDMRLGQLELKAELITGMGKGYLGQIPNSVMAPLFDNAVVNAIRQLVNF